MFKLLNVRKVIVMSLFGRKEKQEIEALKSQLSQERLESIDWSKKIEQQKLQFAEIQKEIENAQGKLQKIKEQIIETDEVLLIQSSGIYTPRYDFMNSDEYRARLLEIRASQKDMIREKTAVSGSTDWTVNGNATKGKKMVSDMQKLLLRAFNSECDDVIEHVKYNNNVYKIGMTRRLDPMERIDELGDASVPFNFDVHAMIFTEDAPGLEAALHNAFADRKVNFVNQRREFFNVSLNEIKEVIKKNYDKTVEFVDIPPAEQYRESLKLRSCISNQ